jgi:hypothetical protein
MFLARLPFDYLQHIDPGDRVRRSGTRPNSSHVRRNAPGGTGE